MITSKQQAERVCAALSDKKGKDILYIDVEKNTSVCDYFVICSASSAPQVKGLCDHVVEKMEEIGLRPKAREGYSEGRWIVLDFGDIVTHIFNDENRLFYHLERLWADGTNMTHYTEDGAPEKIVIKKAKAKKPAAKKATKKKRAAGGKTPLSSFRGYSA